MAAAISLLGLQSGAALATVVGVLVEVPIMLSVHAIVKRTRARYERSRSRSRSSGFRPLTDAQVSLLVSVYSW